MNVKRPVSYLLLDACFTLMDKPQLWSNLRTILHSHGYEVSSEELKQKHKLLSEVITFPDQTSADFYTRFNTELLYALGIIPTRVLLAAIYEGCKYLPWEAYEDTAVLAALQLPIGILSNFNHKLEKQLGEILDIDFKHIFVSEIMGASKPDIVFYQKAIAAIGIPAEEILYIGDSIKLDMVPAMEVGMQAYLIDRNSVFPNFPNRLESLEALRQIDQ